MKLKRYLFRRYLVTARDQLNEDQEEQLHMARAGAKALSSLSESRHNKEIMRKYGLVPLMARLLKSIHLDVVIPIMGTCQHCASQVLPYLLYSLYITFIIWKGLIKPYFISPYPEILKTRYVFLNLVLILFLNL